MTDWYSPLEGSGDLHPLDPADVKAWPDRAFADSQPLLSYCPVGFSEAMTLSQYLPLTLIKGPFGFEMLADLKTFPCFTPEGQWRLGYKPLALRLLPFHADASGQVFQIETAPDIACPEQSEQARQVVARMLASYRQERARATALVQRILKAGLIEPGNDPMMPLLPGPMASSFDAIRLTQEDAGAFQIFTTIAFSQKNHRRKAPLYDLVRNARSFAPLARSSKKDNFASFLDFGEALKW